jgi:hypothetical protein
MVPLTSNEILKLKRKFLSSAINVQGLDLIHNLNIYKIWDEMNLDNDYDKHKVMPFIVEDLIEDGVIKRGEKSTEITLVNTAIREKAIPILRRINDMVNENDFNNAFDVTLDVHGITITGKLMGLRPFYDEVSSMLKEGVGDTREVICKSTFEELKALIPNNEKDWEVVKKLIGNNYICLKDVMRSSGGNLISRTSNDSLWIGKIDSVDGFSIGLLNATPSND